MVALCIQSLVAWFSGHMFHSSAGVTWGKEGRLSQKLEIWGNYVPSLLDSCSLTSPKSPLLGALPKGCGFMVFWVPAHPVGREYTDLPGQGCPVRVTSGALDAPSSGRG